MKLLKEKWLSMVQSAREKGENGTGGSSTVTAWSCGWRYMASSLVLQLSLGDLLGMDSMRVEVLREYM